MTQQNIILADFEILSDSYSFKNGWNDVHGVDPSVIQIGAMKVRLNEAFDQEDTFDVLIRPTDIYGHPVALTRHIQDLTGISQEDMNQQGMALSDACEAFAQFIQDNPIFTYSRTFDYTKLTMSMVHQKLYDRLFPVTQFRDIRPLFIKGGVPEERIPQNQSGNTPDGPIVNSGSLLTFFDIEPPHSHMEHNALHDVLSMHAVLQNLIKQRKICIRDFE